MSSAGSVLIDGVAPVPAQAVTDAAATSTIASKMPGIRMRDLGAGQKMLIVPGSYADVGITARASRLCATAAPEAAGVPVA